MQPALLDHASAILARLETVTLPNGDNLPVGDHKAPKSGDGAIVAPCVVLYLRPGGLQSGDLNQPEQDAWLPFQITCIGKTASQAMQVADRCHTALIGTQISVSGRLVARFRRRNFGSSAERDDDTSPPLFYVPVEYQLWSLTT